jgi:hypothetical protein
MLAKDIQSVVDLTKGNPQTDGLFQALLVVLENAPDRSTIAQALSQLDPNTQKSPELRQRAANLLVQSSNPELARAWLPDGVTTGVDQSNVIALRPSTPLPQTRDGITFADIGGLEAEKDQIRRKIIKPFTSPGLFQAFKRKAGGGVLVYGPPGCGNTVLYDKGEHKAEVIPKTGRALFFRHGQNRDSVLHAGAMLGHGTSKYVARINIMYDL